MMPKVQYQCSSMPEYIASLETNLALTIKKTGGLCYYAFLRIDMEYSCLNSYILDLPTQSVPFLKSWEDCSSKRPPLSSLI